jgi:transcriptional regulator GlxA family with amidase domain
MQYYLDHMERGHNVEEVSRRSELSYRSFHRLFKEQLNIAPKSWMEQEQFKRARRLLETSNLKLSDVAGQCGYSDDKSLIRAFRRLGRETPASYRKAFRTSSAG